MYFVEEYEDYSGFGAPKLRYLIKDKNCDVVALCYEKKVAENVCELLNKEQEND